MAQLAHQQIQITGPAITHAAASTSDTVAADDRVFLWYKSTQGTTEVISIVTPTSLNQFGQDLPNVTVTIPASPGERLIGPLTRDLADPLTGLVTVTIADVTGITVAAVRI